MGNITKLLEQWQNDPEIRGCIPFWEIKPAQKPLFSAMPEFISDVTRTQLSAAGIYQLYEHQKKALDLIFSGKNVVVATGTASGKSLVYQIPLMEMITKSAGTALLVFPTKALTYDQQRGFRDIAGDLFAEKFSIYDGDTPSSWRPNIRRQAQGVLTNPDMLHTGILPHHTRWAEFLKQLKYIVIDEIHIYRGVFGSHFSNVLRRLERICNFYGATPQYILSSATIANAAEFAEKLIQKPVNAIANDTAPHGERHFIIYNPPIINQDLGIRRSALSEGIRLTTDLILYRVQTLLFAHTRRLTEIALMYLKNSDADPGHKFFAYRSGYLAGERREIETALKTGQAKVVTATNALELGIDIGSMDAVIILGYPGTIASTRQQGGRAGRKLTPSASVLIASARPMDQYLVRHPEYLVENPPEKALINPDNPMILLQHLRCSAFEKPFIAGESLGNLNWDFLEPYLDVLAQMGELHRSGRNYYWVASQYPAADISLRSTAAGTVTLQLSSENGTSTLGHVDLNSAHWMVHPGAIYIHQGHTYLVKELNLETKVANLVSANPDYYTEASTNTEVEKIQILAEKKAVGSNKILGEIKVTSQLQGYRKMRWFTYEVLGMESQILPPNQLRTIGFWQTIDQDVVKELESLNLWSNSPNDYGPNWNHQRNQARIRDRFICQHCGHPETDSQHHVHHITPFRQFDNFLLANQLENLVTLCPSCHRKAEGVVRMRSGLAGLSYILSQLAPLFIMCDPNDLGVFSDPQGKFADGAPVVLIYDNVPGGIGLSEQIFDYQQDLIANALDLVTQCECVDGCPSCIGVAGEKGMGGKQETIALLSMLNGIKPDTVIPK